MLCGCITRVIFHNRILPANSKSIGGKCSHMEKMAVHVKRSVKLEGTTEALSNCIHYMPCQIHADGQANVSKYFKPSIKDQDGSDVLCSSFRGYPLMGKVISLPKGYKGIVVQETVRSITADAERNVHVMHTFTSFTYWNWDKPPSLNDALLSALDWVDISEALHSVTDDNSG